MSAELISLDTGSVLVVTCKNNQDGQVLSLTGATVRLRYKIDGGAAQTVVMTITDAANGLVQYQFGDNELAVGLVLVGETEITDGTGKVVTQLEPFVLPLRSRLS
ncbi:BppU family phage baseplate upper protein [Candidatus Nitronereus thalassa]|uniref:BppU family phage baseplate upper protein n=1 Tax=Candidatus Nitronereus thalassa TaxID=3020898 RepID=A0ABU3K389_9BACT|nr:BppU family phage baseplate upper protein [Candidatus Nitronereus thalassa]MDT7040849.1 BppU family phage baseplate upper protein [Candidatus Nitronereus thalassa]